MENYVILRREICNSCSNLKILLGVKICNLCGCSIWAKSMLPNAECPLNKWDTGDNKQN